MTNFLQEGKINLRSKLEWHTHGVSTLKINGNYLYSAGEEGVVVLWHLRENKKDFLPRIGSKIMNIFILDSVIYCFLEDNTIKSIDMGNDKSLLHYKVVVNPHSSILDANSTLYDDLLIRISKNNDKIYLKSVPGKLQEINLSSGFNS